MDMSIDLVYLFSSFSKYSIQNTRDVKDDHEYHFDFIIEQEEKKHKYRLKFL